MHISNAVIHRNPHCSSHICETCESGLEMYISKCQSFNWVVMESHIPCGCKCACFKCQSSIKVCLEIHIPSVEQVNQGLEMATVNMSWLTEKYKIYTCMPMFLSTSYWISFYKKLSKSKYVCIMMLLNLHSLDTSTCIKALYKFQWLIDWLMSTLSKV